MATDNVTPPTHADDLQAPEIETIRRSQELWDRNLAHRETFFRTVFESLAEGLLITNRESRVIYCNARFTEICGYAKEELVGSISYRLLTPPELWPRMEQRLVERLGGRTEVYEHEMMRKDGSRHWVQVRATPYYGESGEIVGTIGAVSCIEERKALEREKEWLLTELRTETGAGRILGQSPILRKILDQIAVVAPTPASVLILGESGTGKELVARAIHDLSSRRDKPLVRVNCASIPKDLFESEFFGHVRGAFTGAVKDRTGRFELAHGGTLFLDEIGEIPLELQSKLLRVLQEGQFERVGEDRTRSVEVRVVAASNRDLEPEARAGRFRLDLYYRLSVFPIQLPPLRDRAEDIAPLAAHFVAQSAARLGVRPPRLLAAHVRQLEEYSWPGNVRELQNVVERAVILARGGPLHFDLKAPERSRSASTTPPSGAIPDANHPLSLVELETRERQILTAALVRSGGRIYGPKGAAALLSLKPTTLASRLQRLGISRLAFRKPSSPEEGDSSADAPGPGALSQPG